ncbi:hypothetical protein N0A02_22995 [Paraburkholderia acidicola]|uniref:Uncharacterized protein n=1 Tax=Paraburkholderia acidicola TaxID=1912599 RepID=A0ABV1LSL2_9BURK
MISDRVTKLILRVLGEVEASLPDQLSSAREHGVPTSLGLTDGGKIVRDYLEHREFGLALEHLTYMVLEVPLSVSPRCQSDINEAASRLRLPGM